MINVVKTLCVFASTSIYRFLFQYDDPNATISGILDEVRKFVSDV